MTSWYYLQRLRSQMMGGKTDMGDELSLTSPAVQGRVWILTAAAVLALVAVTALGLDGRFHFSTVYPKYAPTHTVHLIMPLPSVAILLLYGVALAWMLRKSVWAMVGFVVIVGLAAQLVGLLAELFHGAAIEHPFREARRIFGWYAMAYGAVILGTVAYAAGCLTRRSAMESNWVRAIVAPFLWAAAGGSALLLAFVGLWPLVGVMAAGGLAGWATRDRLRWANLRVTGEWLTRLVVERPALVAGGIFILALFVRLAFAWRIVHLTGADFLLASDDGQAYGRYAAMIAQGQNIPKGSALYMGGLGYWHFLGFIYRLFGLNNYLAVAFVQAIFGAVVPVCAFLIGRWLAGPTVALGAALLSVLSMNLTFLSAVVGMEALFIPFMMVHLVLVVWAVRTEAIRRLFVALGLGGMLGVAYAVRNEVIFFPLVVVLVFLCWGRGRFGLRGAMGAAAGYLAGFVAIYLLGCLYNWQLYGAFTFGTAEAAVTFEGPYGGPENQALVAMGFNPFVDVLRSLVVLVQEPFQVLSLLASGFVKRGVRFIIEPNFGLFDPIFLVNPSSGYVYRYPIALNLYGYALLAVGFWILVRQKQLEHRLVVAYLLYTFSLYAVIAAKNVRHRGVVTPLAYICVIVGFVYGCQALKRWLGQIRKPS
ncbi:glycosyltransferase family 39 protein [Nitrospinae bacterium AH_259_B05_G02_I21]|nr:glycosyltransferase family 39 protein [Nitrospinae bacterium AH_259_B05_G02_I21]MDA2931909.1 glycosyltransferase family 39 protein [Nitrospinae bacterium AH-259-F20]